jgi:hypothetical protein
MPNSVPLVEENLDFDAFPVVPGSKPREMAPARGPGGNTGLFRQVAELAGANEEKRVQ